MEIIYALVGLALGIFIMLLLGKIKEKDTLRKHAKEISEIKEKQHQVIKDARKKSVDTSRNVIRGQIAEKFAPMINGFEYSPSDARFLGDPIDYVVFNGYSKLRDNGEGADNLEVIIVEVKSGRAHVRKEQRAIENAINAGRVRFETIRISEEGEIKKQGRKNTPKLVSQEAEIQQTQKTYARADKKWVEQEIQFVTEKYQQGATLEILSEKIQRPPADVEKKLRELGKLNA